MPKWLIFSTLWLASSTAFGTEYLPNSKFLPDKEKTVITVTQTEGLDRLDSSFDCASGIDADSSRSIELCYTGGGVTGDLTMRLDVQFHINHRTSKKVYFSFGGWLRLHQALARATPECPARITVIDVGDNTLVPDKVFTGCD